MSEKFENFLTEIRERNANAAEDTMPFQPNNVAYDGQTSVEYSITYFVLQL